MNDEFEPTSDHYNWRGKIRCRWCPQTGWPCDGCKNGRCWTNHHGKFCQHRPHSPVSVRVQT